MIDPREGPYLAEVLANKDERDVLADRIQTWADTEDWHVYDYVDRLIGDLDAAGYEIRQKAHDPEGDDTDTDGATLLLAVYIPEQTETSDPDDVADGLLGALNELRRRNEAKRLIVSLIPSPQWVTPETIAVLKRARELVR